MEAVQPTPQISSDSLSQQGEDNTLIWVALGIIAIYWYYKTTERKRQDYASALYEENDRLVDSYSKFIQSPLGSRFENNFLRKGVKPSINQVLRIDRVLQTLSKYEQSVFKKAIQFERRTDVERALTQKELGVYLPIRKKLMEISDSV
jgi:cbb3-type cytochrome oxidase subunit 3